MAETTADTRPSLSSLLLEDQLCFALHHAARAITRAYAEVLGEAGVTYPQYLVMLCLFERDGLSIGELGRLLRLDSGTLTPLVKRMEGDGVVVRRRSTRDERRVEVWLTAAGRSKEDSLLRARRHVVETLGMADADIASLRARLMDMADRLSRGQAGADPGGDGVSLAAAPGQGPDGAGAAPAGNRQAEPGASAQDLDACLARIAAQGDPEAYAALFRRIAPKVKAYMMRSGADAAMAEDLAQETLARIWLKAGLYQSDRGGAEAWILSMARNLRIDRLRREKVWQLSEALPEGHDSEPSSEPPADEQLDARERGDRVRAALASLTAEQRAVIELSYVEGLSHSEIATRLELPLGTIKSRLRLAYDRLRPMLADGG